MHLPFWMFVGLILIVRTKRRKKKNILRPLCRLSWREVRKHEIGICKIKEQYWFPINKTHDM
jgi:hypothetical protein